MFGYLSAKIYGQDKQSFENRKNESFSICYRSTIMLLTSNVSIQTLMYIRMHIYRYIHEIKTIVWKKIRYVNNL